MNTRRKINKGAVFVQVYLVLFSLLVLSCEDKDLFGNDDTDASPMITEVRNYASAPDDTLITELTTGQWVVLLGDNLSEVETVIFGGTVANLNLTFVTENSVIIQVPSISYQAVPKELLDKIEVITSKGKSFSYTLESSILGDPLITHVRNYADSPNDTLLTSVEPGQMINVVGFNLQNPVSIAIQGVAIDLEDVMYTDTSAVFQVPEDFSDGNLALKNRIVYTTSIGSYTYSIRIILPAIEVDPFLELLTGGVGPGKTWAIDFDANGNSTYFLGPMGFSGDELRWGDECATEGGNCWTWFPEWQTWMPGPADYGTMTFSVGEEGTLVTVDQKAIATSGSFEGSYALSFEAKTLSFADVTPLNMGWTSADWSMAYVLELNEEAMRLGFKHKDKAELEIYHYIAK